MRLGKIAILIAYDVSVDAPPQSLRAGPFLRGRPALDVTGALRAGALYARPSNCYSSNMSGRMKITTDIDLSQVDVKCEGSRLVAVSR